MKKLLIGLALIIVLIAGGLFFVGSNLEPLIKAAVEKYGPEVIKVSVKLDKVKLSPTDGQGALSGLTIGNPDGFSTPRAFYLGTIDLQVDPKSIIGDGAIIIKSIVIEKPEITYEVAENGDNNLGVIAKNAQSFGDSHTTTSTDEPKDKQPSKPGRKIIIEKLSISDGKITVSHKLLQGKTLDMALPAIQMSNIGRDKGGLTSNQLAGYVLNLVSANAVQTAKAGLTQQINDTVKQQVEKVIPGAVGQQLKGLFGK